MTAIWERWEGEEAEAYAAFRGYLEQIAPRRLSGMHLVLQVALPTLYSWCARYKWAMRAEGFDAHFRKIRDEHLEALMRESAEKIAEKHAESLADLREIVGAELAKHLAQIKSTPRSVMSFSETVRAAETMIKMDRLIRGLETETVKIDMSETSLEDLKELREHAARAIKGE